MREAVATVAEHADQKREGLHDRLLIRRIDPARQMRRGLARHRRYPVVCTQGEKRHFDPVARGAQCVDGGLANKAVRMRRENASDGRARGTGDARDVLRANAPPGILAVGVGIVARLPIDPGQTRRREAVKQKGDRVLSGLAQRIARSQQVKNGRDDAYVAQASQRSQRLPARFESRLRVRRRHGLA